MKPDSLKFLSHSPLETEGLGEAWGRRAQRGWVIGLTGELGSGKTQWVKGLARGLGCLHPIQSPTFALLNSHSGGRLTLFHLDLYRLDTADQIIGAGLEEFLINPAGVTVVEWADRWLEFQMAPPPHYHAVHFAFRSDNQREIVCDDLGP